MKLVFLGKLADLAGCEEHDFSASGARDWHGLSACLGRLGGDSLIEAAASDSVRIAVNGTLIADKHGLQVGEGDEVAFLPPVSGG